MVVVRRQEASPWQSLASSVSSERAFSSAGITISKRWSRAFWPSSGARGPFPVYQCLLVVSSSLHLAIQHPLGLLFWALGLSLCIAPFQRHNCLKGDIVEALQFLKCLIRCDLIFRADPSASLDDDEDEDEDILTQGGSQFVSDVEKGPSWDDLWLEDDDDAGTKG